MNLITLLLGISLITTVSITAPHTPLEAPTQEVVAEVVYVPDFTTKDGIEAYIRSKDWHDDDLAVRIAICESSLVPTAYNGKGRDNSVGIFQINLYGSLAKSRPSKEVLFSAKENIDYAFYMYQKEGFKPWTCLKKVS